MEPDGSLPQSQSLASWISPDPDHSSSHATSWISILILFSHLRLRLPSVLLPWCLRTKTLYAPAHSLIRAACPAHLIRLDLMTPIIFGEEYRTWSSSVCSLLHSPVTSSLLGPYTRWFRYDRDWFVCKQAALRSSCATLREWSHNLHPPSCSG